MEFLGVGFLIGIIVTIAIVSIMMNSKQEKPQEEYKREISLSEMLTVVNYYYHFEKATPYEKEVMSAILNKLEGELEHEMDKGRD